MIEQKFIELIASQIASTPQQVASAIGLFDKGATLPFVARYRKDLTGNLDETKLEVILEQNVYFTSLLNRRDAILENIAKQEKLTEELRNRILSANDHTTLEDLYLPFKKQRRTKASVAREQGLEPLAERIWSQDPQAPSLQEMAASYSNPDKQISSVESALDGARHIMAEWVSLDADTRAEGRRKLHEEGILKTTAAKNSDEQKTKFEAYYDFSESLKQIPSHRFLAVMRGVRMGLLRLEIVMNDEEFIAELIAKFLKAPGTQYEEEIRSVVEDAYRRLLRPTIETEVLNIIRIKAEDDAIEVFRENAHKLLLAPPAGRLPVIGVDPGFRTGCKLAVIDDMGNYRDTATIYTTPPEADMETAEKTLLSLIEKYQVKAIAVGNGTGSREIARYIDELLKQHCSKDVFMMIVNEAGASIYSASKSAREEFPELDVTVRGAISIARRLQDPLAELVKLEPRTIGVGQYQHDVNQKRLREGLFRTVENCVNRVGVDVNTASVDLLRYISGVNVNVAENIIKFRNEQGGFKNRTQLMEVDGIGEKTFEQCAGFLRIQGGDTPLDATAIHPEAYPIVEQVSKTIGADMPELISNQAHLEKVDFSAFQTELIGAITLSDIKEELLKPGRDPRKEFMVPKFLEGVYSVEDLKEGMETEGVVTNVTDFGAFVDIGIHQDGLVHLSEMSNRFVRDPREVVGVGDIIKIKVIKIDKDLSRISLSMKALLPPAPSTKEYQTTSSSQQTTQSEPAQTYSKDEKSRSEANITKKPSNKEHPFGNSTSSHPGSKQTQKTRKKTSQQKSKQRPPQAQGQSNRSSNDNMNTTLADQLAALKDKFK